MLHVRRGPVLEEVEKQDQGGSDPSDPASPRKGPVNKLKLVMIMYRYVTFKHPVRRMLVGLVWCTRTGEIYSQVLNSVSSYGVVVSSN